MIAFMRKIGSSLVYKLFLWIFLFMMAFSSSFMFINFSEDKKWVIRVYNDTSTQEKFETMLRRAKQQQEMFRQKGYTFTDQAVRKETVKACISDLLAQHVLQNVGVAVPKAFIDDQVQKTFQQLPPYFFKQNGELDEEIFKRALAPNTIEDFVADIELEAKNKLLFGLVDVGVYVPEFEAVLQYNAEFAKKTYEYITLSQQKHLQKAQENVPSDETLNRFYKKTAIAEQFKTAERRAGTMWTFSAANFSAPVTENEAKQWYEKHKMQRYVVEPAQMQIRSLLVKVDEPGKEAQAKAKIEEIHQEAEKNPAEFESLVRKLSDDSKDGGLSSFFTRDNKKMDKAIVDTAFEFLATDGQLSSPVKTSRGYEIIQRVQKNPAKYKDFKSVEASIKEEISADKFKKRFSQDAARVISGAKYNPEMLTKFIERYKGSVSSLSLDVRKAGMEYTQLFKIEEGRYTQFFNKDQGVILLCSKVEKSKLPALADVKSKVSALYFDHQAHESLKEQLVSVLKDAKSMNMKELAQKYGVSVQKATFEVKDSKPEQSAILKEPEVQDVVKNLQHEGAMATVETKFDGYLFKLAQLETRDKASFDEQREHLSKVLSYTKMYQIKEGFIASLYRTATLNNKIDVKKELLQQTKEV